MISYARKGLPRLPLDGKIDLTYRCNNTCRHCWLWLPERASEQRDELSAGEIYRIVDEARQMGCQAWSISGGEPMLREDFSEIFDYITRKSVTYSLNTNGTLITPEIARLMRRKGRKMIALYGATAEVHDQVTRNPGSFEAAMRGFSYLKEAGAGFEVQIIPMRANYHQYGQMLALAETLSPDYRVGAPWIFLSACGSAARNREIASQRLDPAEVLVLDTPDPSVDLLRALDGPEEQPVTTSCGMVQEGDSLFESCIAARRDFHIDPYGQLSFCYFVKDPALRFDLRKGSFRQAWEEFLPSLKDVVRGGDEYRENCGSCELRGDCRWCGVYGYLEHRRFSAKVEYLCSVAAETRRYKEEWKLSHVRYYQIAGITIQLSADFPFAENTFAPKYEKFRVEGPGDDNISIRLVTTVPPLSELRLGKKVYHKAPWVIYQQAQSWVYLGIRPDDDGTHPHSVSIYNSDHSRGTICRPKEVFDNPELESLTTYSSDQILLARILADRQGCYLHASGIMMDGQGLMFVGHSEAGKTTTMMMLREHGEVLCDDRIIIRRWPDGVKIHGTWSHGDLPEVSPASAPLRAILFLEKADTNELIPVTDPKERVRHVLTYIIRPLVDAGWWEKTLTLIEQIAREVPMYRMRFDLSGRVLEMIQPLLPGQREHG